MPEARHDAGAAARLHHRHPRQRPARPHAGDGRCPARLQMPHLLRRERPRLRRGGIDNHRRLTTTWRSIARFAEQRRRRHLRVRERAGRRRGSRRARAPGAARPARRSRSRRTGSRKRRSLRLGHSRSRRFAAVASPDDFAAAVAEVGAPAILKTRRLGYDGKGQARIEQAGEIAAAFEAVGRAPAVLEALVASSARCRCWSCAAWPARRASTTSPPTPRGRHPAHLGRAGALPPADAARAREIAGKHRRRARLRRRAGGGDVLRRPTGRRAADGQRDRPARAQHRPLDHRRLRRQPVREPHPRRGRLAAGRDRPPFRLPDGQPDRRRRDAWPQLAAEPGACLHLYGKHEARPGRKMGHVTRLSALSKGR